MAVSGEQLKMYFFKWSNILKLAIKLTLLDYSSSSYAVFYFILFRSHAKDFNMQDNAGNTPIHVAVECDSFDALEYLLSM